MAGRHERYVPHPMLHCICSTLEAGNGDLEMSKGSEFSERRSPKRSDQQGEQYLGERCDWGCSKNDLDVKKMRVPAMWRILPHASNMIHAIWVRVRPLNDKAEAIILQMCVALWCPDPPSLPVPNAYRLQVAHLTVEKTCNAFNPLVFDRIVSPARALLSATATMSVVILWWQVSCSSSGALCSSHQFFT